VKALPHGHWPPACRTGRGRALRSLSFCLLLLASPAALLAWVDEPDDPLFRRDPLAGVEEQWNLMADGRGIGVTEAWKTTHGDPAVIIANIDCGVNYRHEDLRNQLFLNTGELPLPQGPDGVPAASHDRNEDGVVNVLDYASDPRVEDRLGDGVDVGDLLGAFGDGADDDGNGFPDDVSGWDFFDRDSDVFDAGAYGHGTQTASIHSAETNNGRGMAGIAPGCRLLALRIGDAPHISHSHLLGAAVRYAADQGASVASMSLGCMSSTSFLREAFRYAASRGVLCVAAMGNEYSFHHNVPAVYEDVMGVGALHPDTSGLPYPLFFPSSWVTRANYSDYGGHTDLAAPSWVEAARFPDGYQGHSGGTSNATPHVSGTAALLFSAARERLAWPPVTPAEVRQILRGTAEDITGTVYRCKEGFDAWTGYGRLRADRAVAAAAAGRIPPGAALRSPEWFRILDPLSTPLVSVQGETGAPRSAGYSYEVAWAPGVEPGEPEFRVLYASSFLDRAVQGELCLWDIREVFETPAVPPASPNDPAATLRLRVTDAQGRTAEDRRTVFVHHDPTWHGGFPLQLAASLEASPRLADLDGDNRLEIVQATSDGQVLVLREDGTPLDSVHGRQAAWPALLDPAPDPALPAPAAAGAGPCSRRGDACPQPLSPVVAAPAVGDLDGDGLNEIVVAAADGKVYVFEPDGSRRPGFPAAVDPAFSQEDPWLEPGFLSSPALADLDGDGALEIVAAAMDQRVYAWREDGRPHPGWPAVARDPREPRFDKIVSSVAVGDIDGIVETDGRRHLEVVVGANELAGALPLMTARVYAFGSDGRLKPGWPAELFTPMGEMLPTVGKGVPMSPLLTDLDSDGALEVIAHPVMGAPAVLSGRGRLRATLPAGAFGSGSDSAEPLFLALPANASLADLNRDGTPELLLGGVGLRIAVAKLFEGLKIEFDHLLGAWDLARNDWLEAFPRITDGIHFITQPAVADVDGDGGLEVLDGTSHYLLRAFTAQGLEPPDWPKFTGGWIVGCPAVGDLDGDGHLEVVLGTREGTLFAWDTTGSADQPPEWWSFHHDRHSTGNRHADTLPPASVDDLRATPAARGGAAGVLLSWTAVGDDGRRGTAAAYELRVHPRPLDPFNWPEAERVDVPAAPAPAGTREELFLEGFGGAAFFGIRARDAAGNLSGLYPRGAAGPSPAAAAAGAAGGCGCAVLPGSPGGRSLQPLAGSLLFCLPLLLAAALKTRFAGDRGAEPGDEKVQEGDLPPSHFFRRSARPGRTPPVVHRPDRLGRDVGVPVHVQQAVLLLVGVGELGVAVPDDVGLGLDQLRGPAVGVHPVARLLPAVPPEPAVLAHQDRLAPVPLPDREDVVVDADLQQSPERPLVRVQVL